MAMAAAEAFNVWLLRRPQPAVTAAPAQETAINPFTDQAEGAWLGKIRVD
jgi:hypothetical protein